MQYADPLTKLYVEITTICNLNCLMCVRRVWNEPIGSMPLATFSRLMDEIKKLPTPPTIHLGGYGEPLCHPDFLEIVRQAKATGARVEVTSNGTRLTQETAASLIEIGLDRLVVSIDGVTSESYGDIRTNSDFERVVDNLKGLRRLQIRAGGRHGNPRIGIAFVAMKRNIHDLPELPRLATRVGAWEIQVSNLVPHTEEMEAEILYSRSLSACTYRTSRWVANLSLPKFDLDSYTLAPMEGAFGSTASISMLDASLSGRNNYCRFAQEGYAAIRWDGEVSPCLELLHDHPVYLRGRRKDMTHHSLGNINKTGFVDLWGSPEFSQLRSTVRAFPFSPCTTCGGCDRFAENKVDCTENTFSTCGGCLWAQGFVQCP